MLEIIKKQIENKIHYESDSDDCVVVHPPIYRGDGDGYTFVFKKVDGEWILTDEGFTFENENYSEKRYKVISEIEFRYGIYLEEGALNLKVIDGNFGDAFFEMCEECNRIANLDY